MKLCGAKTRNGGHCKAYAMPNGRCRVHGGTSLKGVHHPDYKDGKHSKYNPTNIASRFEKALNDPNLTSIKHDIARTQALLEDQWDTLDHAPDAAKSWAKIGQIVDMVEAAFISGDAQKILDAQLQLPKARGIISQNQRFHEAKKEVQHTLEQKRKQLDTKTKIEQAESKSMSYEQALLFMSTLFRLIDEEVQDVELKYRISTRLQQYVGVVESLP